jgi:hypothetical protein
MQEVFNQVGMTVWREDDGEPPCLKVKIPGEDERVFTEPFIAAQLEALMSVLEHLNEFQDSFKVSDDGI